jgi:hypothetical protein
MGTSDFSRFEALVMFMVMIGYVGYWSRLFMVSWTLEVSRDDA